MGSLSNHLQEHCTHSFRSTSSTNTKYPSAIRNIKKLCKIRKLPSAISNAFNNRKQETKESTCLSDVGTRSTHHNTSIFDPVAGEESESGPSISSCRSDITYASYTKPTNQSVVDDESDPFSDSFSSAVAELPHLESTQESIDFSNAIIWDQMGPFIFNSRDQMQLSSNFEIKGNGKRKMGCVGYGLKSLKYTKRWKQIWMNIKLLSCSNLLSRKKFVHVNKPRNSSSDSSDGKSTSFGSALCSSCSSLSSDDDHSIELMAQITRAMEPTAQVKNCEGDDQDEFWMKRILMGKKCRPLDFSEALHFDENGNLLRELPEKA